MVFISPRLKFNEEEKKNPQWSEIGKTKIALRSQPGGIECHLCFIIYGEAMHFFLKDLSFPHVAGNYALPVVELPCFTAY